MVNFGGVGQILGDLAKAQGSHRSLPGGVFVVLPHYAFITNTERFGRFTFMWGHRRVHGEVSWLRLDNVTYLLIGPPSSDASLWKSMDVKDIYNTRNLHADERDVYFSFAASQLIRTLHEFVQYTYVHVHGATNAPALVFLRKLNFSGQVVYTIHDYSSEPAVRYRGHVVAKFFRDNAILCPLKPSTYYFCDKHPYQNVLISCFSRMRLKMRAYHFMLCSDHVTTVSHGILNNLLEYNSHLEHVIVQLASERKLSVVHNWVSADVWNLARKSISWNDPVSDKKASKRTLIQLFDDYGHGDLSKVDVSCFIGWTGRFELNKGVHLLPHMLAAACELRCLLVVSGFSTNVKDEGIFQRSLAKMQERGCPFLLFDHVEVQKTHFASIRASVDITIVPSKSEAYGLVAAEALAFASVPVVSAVGGLQEVVKQPDKTASDDVGWTGFTFLFAHSSPELTGGSMTNAIKLAVQKVRDTSDKFGLYRRLILSTPLVHGHDGRGGYHSYMRLYDVDM